MKKKILAVLVAVGVITGLATGCGSETKTQTTESVAESKERADEEAETVNLKIGAQPYPLYTPVYVAKELGYLDEEFENIGATYEWNDFKSGPLVNEAVAAGEADMGFMADLPAIIAKSTGQDIEIVSGVAYGEKGLAVLVKPDSEMNSVADLKGKKIAYATGSYAQHLLALLLEQEGLSLDDVESINLGAGDQPLALESGEVDAIVIWEQYISLLTSEGSARVLADGTGIKKGNMVNYFVKEYAEAHPDVVNAYNKALKRADEFLASDPDAAAEAVYEDFGVSLEVMKQIITNFEYNTEMTEDDIAEITKVKDFSLQAGIISNDVDMDDFINLKYLENLN